MPRTGATVLGMDNYLFDLAEIEHALDHGELVYFYQPKVSLVTGRVSGVEALIRWLKPDGSMIMPGRFIPFAESAGFINLISRGMFPRLVEDMVIINDLNDDISVSFNLSAQDIASPEMIGLIRAAVHSNRISPNRLQVEITEASVISGSDGHVRRHVQELVELGVKLAMDDYGIGYSSIDTLSRWPFSVVKIDQGLIRRMAESEKSTTIVQASIRMAHQLGLEIVAEGIENADIYEFLLHTGCTHAQGFWLGRPMPLQELLEFIRCDRRWSALPVGLIHMAQLDHIQWRRALVCQVTALSFGKTNANDVCTASVQMDYHECKLGEWYYGIGQEFKGIDAFDQLEEPHRKLHALGAELLALARSGGSRQQITAALRALTRQSGIVLELLQDLENEAILRVSRAANSTDAH